MTKVAATFLQGADDVSAPLPITLYLQAANISLGGVQPLALEPGLDKVLLELLTVNE